MNAQSKSPNGELLPSLAILAGAVLWGLFWIPVRGVEAAGVHAYWVGPVIFAASSLLFLPLVFIRRRAFAEHWRSIWLPGLMSGFAFALYIASINLTDVVRAILLFYMTPLWSTLLGVLILNERLTLNRIAALVLAAGGLYAVLAVGDGLPIPQNIGDWFALISGLFWSIASVKLFQGGNHFIVEKVITFVVFALVLSLSLVFAHQDGWALMPELNQILAGRYWVLLLAVAMLPICFLTIWPATMLSPGRVGMLLLGEVIVGVVSAALLIDEPFGTRELLGTLLIVAAGAVEVLRRPPVAPV